MNVWFNSVQFTRYKAENQNVSENWWPICYKSWHWWVLESIWLPLNPPSYITILSPCLYPFSVYQIVSLFHKLLQHSYEGYYTDTAEMNARKAIYAYDIALSTANLAAAF
jgi:hypothetical protein